MAVSNETLKREYMALALRELLSAGKIVMFTPASGEVHVTGVKAVTNLAALIADNAVKSFRATPDSLVVVEPPPATVPMPTLTAAPSLAVKK